MGLHLYHSNVMTCICFVLFLFVSKLIKYVMVYRMYHWKLLSLKKIELHEIRCGITVMIYKYQKLLLSQNSQGNTCVRVSLLVKLQASARVFIKKETLAQVFSCEFFVKFLLLFFRATPMNLSLRKNNYFLVVL